MEWNGMDRDGITRQQQGMEWNGNGMEWIGME